MLSISSEELQDLLHAQLASTSLSTFDSLVCELAFLFLELEDSLFDGVFDGDLVDYHVDLLGQAVNAVDGLLFYELGSVRFMFNSGNLRSSQDSKKAQE